MLRRLTPAFSLMLVAFAGCTSTSAGAAEWEEWAIYDVTTSTGVEGWVEVRLLDRGEYLRAEVGAVLGARGSGANGMALAAIVEKDTGIVDQVNSADYVFPRGVARLVPASHAFFLDGGSLDGKRGLIPLGPQWPWLAGQSQWGSLEFQVEADRVSTRQTCQYGCMEDHDFTLTMEGMNDGLLPHTIVEEIGGERIQWKRAEHQVSGDIDIQPRQPLDETHVQPRGCGWIPCGTDASGAFGYDDAYATLTQDPRWIAYTSQVPDWQPYKFLMTTTPTWWFHTLDPATAQVEIWIVGHPLGLGVPVLLEDVMGTPYAGPADFQTTQAPFVPMEGLIAAVEEASGRDRSEIGSLQLTFNDAARNPSPLYSAHLWVLYRDPLDVYILSAGTGQVTQSTQRSLLAAPS